MNKIRFSALVLSILMIFSLTACRGDEQVADVPQENTTNNVIEDATEEVVSDESVTEETTVTEEKVTVENEETTITDDETISSVKKEETTKKPALSDEWTKEKIVETYKNAAKKSNASAKSAQKISLKKISVNNGEFEGFFDFIMPIMSKLLANNSKETTGITGGYKNLAASDIATAKAYKVGNNTALEMVMREQVSGPSDDAQSGSVGHVITAVGDIGAVVTQLKDLGIPLELSEKDTKIYYTKPVVKVLINSNGEIVKGTWKYTVEIRMDNYKAFGKDVETTSVIMDNAITVNGGF